MKTISYKGRLINYSSFRGGTYYFDIGEFSTLYDVKEYIDNKINLCNYTSEPD